MKWEKRDDASWSSYQSQHLEGCNAEKDIRETDKEQGLQSLSTSNTTPEPLACLSSSDDLGVPVEVAVAPEHLQRGAHSSEWGCGEGKQQRIWTL